MLPYCWRVAGDVESLTGYEGWPADARKGTGHRVLAVVHNAAIAKMSIVAQVFNLIRGAERDVVCRRQVSPLLLGTRPEEIAESVDERVSSAAVVDGNARVVNVQQVLSAGPYAKVAPKLRLNGAKDDVLVVFRDVVRILRIASPGSNMPLRSTMRSAFQ